MATLNTIIARLPYEFQQRYAEPQWIVWINELLEELSGEGFLMPSIDKEIGCVVADLVWIDKPSGLRVINKIWNPVNVLMPYQFKEVNEKIKLLDVEIDVEDSPDTADAFANYAVGSMDIDIADAAENDYKDYLLVIDGGTETGRTIRLSGNDASALGYTKVYFYHDLKAVLDAAKITSCFLTGTDYYVMLEGSFSYEDITAGTDEVPIDNSYEKRITRSWLRWKAEEATIAISDETAYYRAEYKKIINKIKSERGMNVGRVQPRYIPGLDQYKRGADRVKVNFAETDRY